MPSTMQLKRVVRLVPGALDVAGTKARAAYGSNRRPTIQYRGPLFRVRRDSDSTERDIYPNPVTGWCNVEQLKAFSIGAGGFTKTAYDLTGNGRAITQATTTKQPKVYDSSTGAIKNGSNVSMRFDGTDDVLAYTTNSLGFGTGDTALTLGVLMKFNTSSPNSSNPGGSTLVELGTPTNRFYPYYSQTGNLAGSNVWHWTYSAVAQDPLFTPSPAMTNWHYNVLLHGLGDLPAANIWRQNGVALTRTNTPTTEAFQISSAGAFYLGNMNAGNRPMNGDVALCAIFPAKLAGTALTQFEAHLEFMRAA